MKKFILRLLNEGAYIGALIAFIYAVYHVNEHFTFHGIGSRRARRSSPLLVALFLCLPIGIFLGGYLWSRISPHVKKLYSYLSKNTATSAPTPPDKETRVATPIIVPRIGLALGAITCFLILSYCDHHPRFDQYYGRHLGFKITAAIHSSFFGLIACSYLWSKFDSKS